MADAATSVFAIIALLGGKYFSWSWLDPVMGIVGASVISVWSYGLIRDTGRILLDWNLDSPVIREIHEAIESDGDTKICDLHIWQIGRNKYACIIQLVAHRPKSLEEYRKSLARYPEIAHVVIEINQCPGPECT